MIISPPFLRNRDASQSDAGWVDAMMPVSSSRGYPLNASDSWHGGIHISHTDSGAVPNKVRAIADGTVESFRVPSKPWKRDQFPLKYSPIRGTDDGYVLLKHETEIGSGEDGKIVFYSLYIHLKHLEAEIHTGSKIYRKAPIGSSGMTDGKNEFHFQIFCDDANISKLVGRATGKLNIDENGRTDVIYGDIHFYLPAGTKFYESRPSANTDITTNLNEIHTSEVPLYASMSFCKGACTMITRQACANAEDAFETVGSPLVNADGKDYEYNLYKTATSRYPQSPSAGYELLRFGRIINTEHETLVPATAPLWMTVNYPGGQGVVNLAVAAVKKFSDADFPHWTGWQLVDDDKDTHSQCNSAAIRKLREEDRYAAQSRKLICCMPFEWEKSTIDARYKWLMTGLPWEQCTPEKTAIWQISGTNESKDRVLMNEKDYDRFKQHAEALCFDSGALGSGKVWHFDPRGFIEHFRKCGWLSLSEITQTVPSSAVRKTGKNRYAWEAINSRLKNPGSILVSHINNLNNMMRKYCINTPYRISCFLGNAVQETQWLTTLHEGNGGNLWYAPWYGRGFLQLTNPENYLNYFEHTGVFVNTSLKNSLVNAYALIAAQPTAERSNVTLQDRQFPTLPSEIIKLRERVSENNSSNISAADSAGFYWVKNKMAKYADMEHILERVSVNSNSGTKHYYRSPSFWKASAAVNLPGRINNLYSSSLNGFDARCCAYGVALAILSEDKFPDTSGNLTILFPEGYIHRK
ncbi:hydroxyethylthiazole kinase [Ewingella allii]|uniref:hydroxyethylthiazole kinase n=1 Tax=Ewingella allii TaxID=3092550 RepID=UPI0037BDA59D